MSEQAQARPEETAQALLEDLRSGKARVIYEDAEGCHSRVYGADSVAAAAEQLVPAVTPEAVAATRLYALLEAASSNLPQGSLPQGELDALVTLGLVDGSDPHAAVPLTEQGRTVRAALAAGEPGEPGDGELLDALEGIARDWWSQDEAGELSLVTMDVPIPESMCPLQEKTTLRDLARAIIAAQRGGKETD